MTPLLNSACATCNEAILWSLYAPAIHWRWITMFWFFFLTVVQLRTDGGLPGFPKKGTSFAICLLSLFLSVYVLGVFLAVVLIIPCLRCLITVLWKHQKTLSRETKNLVYIPAIISMVAFSSTALYEAIHPSDKDPVSFVLRYPGTAPAQSTIKRLGKETPPNLTALRTIIQQAPPHCVEIAVSTLLESNATTSDQRPGYRR